MKNLFRKLWMGIGQPTRVIIRQTLRGKAQQIVAEKVLPQVLKYLAK